MESPVACVTSKPTSRQRFAPGAVSIAEAEFGEMTFALPDMLVGLTRTPEAVGMFSPRTTIQPVPLPFVGNTKLPVNVAPLASTTSSPGCAASRVACRSPPAFTRRETPVRVGNDG